MPNVRPKFDMNDLGKVFNDKGELDLDIFKRWQQFRRYKNLPDSLPVLMRDANAFQLAKEAEAVRRALLDLATGAYVEEIDKNGVRRVYQRLPDVKAAKEVCLRLYGSATSLEAGLADQAKARSVEEEIKARLHPAKAEQFRAQTARAEIDTKVYAMSQMDQKEIGRKFKSLLNACLAWVTMTPRATIQKAAETEESWQQYKADFGAKLKQKARDILLNEDGGDLQTAITAAREEESED